MQLANPEDANLAIWLSVPQRAMVVLACLGGSLAAVAVAPFLLPGSYSWVHQSVSESAAQGVDHAWIARLGFLLLGAAVLQLAQLEGPPWCPFSRAAHRIAGTMLIAAAVFSRRPWQDVPFDRVEDTLHGVAVFGVGIGFTAGLVILARRPGRTPAMRAFDAVVLVVAIVLPLVPFRLVLDQAGVAQRLLFLGGYLWYGTEAARTLLASRRRAPATEVRGRPAPMAG